METARRSLGTEIVEVIRRVTGQAGGTLPLHEPEFSGNEWTYVKECIDTGWVSSVGAYVDLFEKRLQEFTGIRYAVAVVNGTAALHICLMLSGVRPGDEVLIPSLTFIATANAVSYCGAIPHFVDNEFRTLGLDSAKLQDYLQDITEIRSGICYNKITGRPIRAVIPMHTFGHAVDMDRLVEVANRYSLQVIEDAAEALGTYYKGKHVGNWGTLAALSFNGNKIITTGGGGAILTNDEALAKKAKHLSTTAKVPHSWEYVHDEIGYNYRLPNLNAALGCAQMEQLPVYLEKKRKLAEVYCKSFSEIDGLRFYTEHEFTRSNYWLNVLLLDVSIADQKDEILRIAHSEGVMVRPAWKLLHQLDPYRSCPQMNLETAGQLASRIINIPSSVNLADQA